MDIRIYDKEDGEYIDEFTIAEWIKSKNKKCIFYILEYFYEKIFEIEKQIEIRDNDKLKKLLNTINRDIDLAEEYPSVKMRLDYDGKLWKLARQFIVSKGLQDEFNLICDKEMK